MLLREHEAIDLVRAGFSGLELILAREPDLARVRALAVDEQASVRLVGVGQRFAYCASKSAEHAMTRQMAVEYPRELRVNAIAPGTVETPFTERYLDKYHAHEKEKMRE